MIYCMCICDVSDRPLTVLFYVVVFYLFDAFDGGGGAKRRVNRLINRRFFKRLYRAIIHTIGIRVAFK
jgi:hypothetical protein